MISFEGLLLAGGVPIYLQIVLFIKRGIVAGTIRNAEELPSRRVLSALLGVNPNTVQKAYRILEDEGLIVSHTGAKSCVCADARTAERLRQELLAEDIKEVVSAMRQMGLTKEAALELIETYWD